MTKIYSGGAPIPPSVVTQFADKFGHYIHNGYGLTETNSPTHAVPLTRTAPVDPTSGALSIGVPWFNTISRICDDNGDEVAVGDIGEIVPRKLDPRSVRHRDQVDGEVGRAARRVQADDAVDHRALVDDMADRRERVALGGQLERAPRARFRERVAQRRVRIDKGGAR